jgi:hypothetical protein
MSGNATLRLGGRTRDEWLNEFWDAISDIDVLLATDLQGRFGRDGTGLPDLILDLYWMRSGEAFAYSAAEVMARLTLSHAVAASANFPPVFTPFRIRLLYDGRRAATVLALTDGGVFDNQGIEALRDEDCTDIIASDAGGLVGVDLNPSAQRLPMMVRVVDTLMANLRGNQLASLREQVRVSKGIVSLPRASDPEGLHDRYRLCDVAFFHMNSNPNDAIVPDHPALSPHPLAATIARIRTDLDVFCDVEADALIYQGYQLADRFVRTYMPDLAPSPAPPADPIDPNGCVRTIGDRDERILRAGSLRFGRLAAIYPRATWVAAIVCGLILLGFLIAARCSIAAAVELLCRPVGKFLAFPFKLELPRAVLNRSYGVAVLFILIAAIASLRALPKSIRARWPIPARNWLWFVYAFPLALIAIGAAVGLVIVRIVTPILCRVGRRA